MLFNNFIKYNIFLDILLLNIFLPIFSFSFKNVAIILSVYFKINEKDSLSNDKLPFVIPFIFEKCSIYIEKHF